MSGGDCGCGCGGSGGCGGPRRDWLMVTGAPMDVVGRVTAPTPLQGIDDPEGLAPEGTSPAIDMPELPSLPSAPTPGSLGLPPCTWWLLGGFALGYVLG